jgi:hypothetical protein
MSHNTTQINSQSPDATGEITLPLNALSGVSASAPSANDLIVYGGATWGASADLIAPQSARGNGGNTTSESSTLHVFPNAYLSGTDPNRMFWEYAPTVVNYTPYLSTSTTSDTSFRSNNYGGAGQTLWTCGFNFATAGVYALRAALHIGGLSSAGAYIDGVWTDINYNKLGPITRFAKSEEKRNTMRGIIDASAGDVAGLYVTAYSGARYNRASLDTIFIEIERIA